LLTRLDVHTTTVTVSLYMLVLGLGLGMVMQVLVLAVQNAVDYRMMGVATSGGVLFRQVGGSVGIALFGAIFINHLHANLRGLRGVPRSASPVLVRHLPPAVHATYVGAFSAALHPIFVVATGVSAFAFVLTWFLREVPLRQATHVDAPAGDAAAATASQPE
jgi:hypothetical protein